MFDSHSEAERGGPEPAVVMRGVARELAQEPAAPVRLLDGVDLTLERGGLLHVVGPSGSGKSSLIRLINRLDEPTAGRLEVLGRPIDQWPVRLLRRRVGMAFQEPSLLGLTVRENLRLPFDLNRSMPADLAERIDKLLEQTGLSRELLDRDETRLSVGQKQRVALARALIVEPELLLLDEPTASLDPRSAERLLDNISAIRDERTLSLVMVTHRLQEARRLGGSMAVLIDGRIVARGAVDSLIADPPEAARLFLAEDPR
jgi:ABC-type methionine transport system ATPase subunit